LPPEPRLRVCIPIALYPPSFAGHGIQIQRSLPFLAARGIEPTVLTWAVPGGPDGLLPDPVGRVDRLLTPAPGRFGELRRVLQFRRYFEARRAAFDVIHSAMLGWEFLLNIGRLRRLGMPVLFEMVLLGSDDPMTLSRERFGAFKLRRLKEAAFFTGISGPFRSEVLAAGIPARRYRLVPTGVDMKAYRPLAPDERRTMRARLGFPPEGRLVVSVGSVNHRKGVDRLLRAWERVRPVAGRDLLVIVGPASLEQGLLPEDLEYAARQLAASRGPALSGTVRWAGAVENVQDYLGAADLFLFLSRREGLGTVIIEASACGLPCVVSPLDGIAAEMVESGTTGVILDDPDDAGAVADCVTGLLDDPVRRSALGAAARRAVERRFSFEARADALAAIYRDLAAGRA